MKPSLAFEAHRADIRRIVEANRGLNPRVFGSVLHGNDTEESDLDILIDAAPRFTLFDLARIALEIEQLINKKVDLGTPDDLPAKFRPQVVAEARPI
jgi:predicted nucleotidyltransferase